MVEALKKRGGLRRGPKFKIGGASRSQWLRSSSSSPELLPTMSRHCRARQVSCVPRPGGEAGAAAPPLLGAAAAAPAAAPPLLGAAAAAPVDGPAAAAFPPRTAAHAARHVGAVAEQQNAAALLAACNGENCDLYAAILEEVGDEGDGDDDERSLSEPSEGNDQLVYVFGFDVAGIDRKAWRMLVGVDGEGLLGKEYASHCSDPPDGFGMMLAHFLDGTVTEIPGMFFENCAAPASKRARTTIFRRPAAAVCEPSIEDKNESESDSGEIEYECIDPPERFLNSYVKTTGLSSIEWNNKAFEVLGRRNDGRLKLRLILDDDDDLHPNHIIWVEECKVTSLSKRQLLPFLCDVVIIGTEMFKVKAYAQMGQSGQMFLVRVSTAEGQIGQVSDRSTGDDLVKAFKVAMTVMQNLEQEFTFHGTLPVKAAFKAERSLVVKLFAHGE